MPKITLIKIHWVLSPLKISWCPNVAVNPLINRTRVFNKGTWKGGIINNPVNGQEILPLERGAILVWKNLQNTLKKNQTSLKRNQISPHFSDACTKKVWWPCRALSRKISRNQIKNNINILNNANKEIIKLNPNLNQKSIDNIAKNLTPLILKGSHLLSTKWDNCHVIFNLSPWKRDMH